MRARAATIGLTIALLWAGSAPASVLVDPYDNVLAPDGFYGLAYFNYFHATELRGLVARSNDTTDADFNAMVTLLRPIGYFHAGPVPLAFQVIVPFGKVEEKKIFDQSSSGLGDVILGPGVFLYANEKSGTDVSYWFYAYAPTGAWDKDKAINFGAHHWYFEHQVALFQTVGKLVNDANINYYHHNEEPDNHVKLPPRLEVAVSSVYPVTEKLMIGAHGGGYWDLQKVKADGASIDDSKARKVSLGPTLTYQITEKLGSSLRWTHDLAAANDFKGNDVWLRLNYTF
jgi:hypothetical protein